MKCLLVVLVVFFAFASLANADKKSLEECMKKVFPIDMKMGQNVSATCVMELGLKEEDMAEDAKSWKSDSFDDQCYTKCLGEGIGLIKDGKFQEKNLFDIIDKNSDSDVKDKLKPILKECIKSKSKQSESTDMKESCKGFKNLWICLAEEMEKTCQ